MNGLSETATEATAAAVMGTAASKGKGSCQSKVDLI
jgi:hypothetical protein